MVTYLVHMRSPRRLLAELGLKRFLGVQAFFVGTLAQFLLAPVLWSFWLIPLGLPHPLAMSVSPGVLWTICGLFLFTELMNFVIGCVAVSGARHRFLIEWAVTLPLYFPMAALAAYKALLELICRPFYFPQSGLKPPTLVGKTFKRAPKALMNH